MKSEPGRPMAPGSAAVAQVRLIGYRPGWWGDGRPEDTLMKLIIVAGALAIVGAVAIGLYVVTQGRGSLSGAE